MKADEDKMTFWRALDLGPAKKLFEGVTITYGPIHGFKTSEQWLFQATSERERSAGNRKSQNVSTWLRGYMPFLSAGSPHSGYVNVIATRDSA